MLAQTSLLLCDRSLQVDVEGFEPLVMKSAQRLLTDKNVENIILEYNPGTRVPEGCQLPLQAFQPGNLLGLSVLDSTCLLLPAATGVAESAMRQDPAWSHLITGNPEMLLSLLNKGYRIGFVST